MVSSAFFWVFIVAVIIGVVIGGVLGALLATVVLRAVTKWLAKLAVPFVRALVTVLIYTFFGMVTGFIIGRVVGVCMKPSLAAVVVAMFVSYPFDFGIRAVVIKYRFQLPHGKACQIALVISALSLAVALAVTVPLLSLVKFPQ